MTENGSRSVRLVRQRKPGDCGIAALAMVLRFHRLPVALRRLRDECGVSSRGSSAVALVESARKHGLNAQTFKLDIDALPRVAVPAILHIRPGHFVVMERTTQDYVDLLDPALGRFRMPMRRLARSFTGIVVVISPRQRPLIRAERRAAS